MIYTALLQPNPELLLDPTPAEYFAMSSSSVADAAPDAAAYTVSSGDAGETGELVTMTVDQSYIDALLASNQRQEEQLEGVISCLLIILLVGLLKYIYKFFNMFF